MKYDKLFADFEGRSVSELHGDIVYADWDGVHSVKYGESWDWIMSVWEKFRLLKKEIKEEEYHSIYMGHCYRISNAISWLSIDDVIEKLSEGIKWYNKEVAV